MINVCPGPQNGNTDSGIATGTVSWTPSAGVSLCMLCRNEKSPRSHEFMINYN